MSQPFDLTRLLDGLKRQYGELKHSKKWNSPYYRIDVSERFEFLKILVKAIKDAGKEEEYFTNQRREEITEELIPYERSIDKTTRNLCRLGVLKDLRMAIADIYAGEDEVPKAPKEKPFEKEFQPKENGSDVQEVVDPEMAKLLGFDDE